MIYRENGNIEEVKKTLFSILEDSELMGILWKKNADYADDEIIEYLRLCLGEEKDNYINQENRADRNERWRNRCNFD